MSGLAFERETFEAELLDPRHGFEPTRTPVEVRRDPLIGNSARILPAGSFPRPPATTSSASQPRPATRALSAPSESRNRRRACLPGCGPKGGSAPARPSCSPTSSRTREWSSVSVYSSERHLLPLPELTRGAHRGQPPRPAQVLTGRARVRSDRAVDQRQRESPAAVRQLDLPSAPAGQREPLPTTMQRLLAAVHPRISAPTSPPSRRT